MPCDRLVGGTSKRNHRVRFAGHGAVRLPRSIQNELWAERVIQTLLNEWAYARPHTTNRERAEALPLFVDFYNRRRPHTALGGRSPLDAVNNVSGDHI